MKTLIDRFTEKVEEPDDPHNDCWNWKGSRSHDGYARIWLNGKNVTAHRVSHELFIGPIPVGHAVDHICRNRACVRPEHLQALDHYTNNSQWNLGKTHCPQGHPYAGDNLIKYRDGHRICRICHNKHQREWQRARKLERQG